MRRRLRDVMQVDVRDISSGALLGRTGSARGALRLARKHCLRTWEIVMVPRWGASFTLADCAEAEARRLENEKRADEEWPVLKAEILAAVKAGKR